MDTDETGPEFEIRALRIARAIHDPGSLQGPIIYQGRERDAVFVDATAINAYEFTVRRDVKKARDDARKLMQMLTELQRQPDNAFKSLTGWFVTREEPNAEQRKAISQILHGSKVAVHVISVATLQHRLCDSEKYLNARTNAPFGSIAYSSRQNLPAVKVPVSFFGEGVSELSLQDVVTQLLGGKRFLLSGEFGTGKSHALREIYATLRKMHFRKHKLTPFPLHINLRDCVGLRSPSEVIRRHSEEIGFADSASLISAWRAGSCVLLLDGFDEVVPPRWLGSASDLKSFRWQALSAVRKLVQESPHGVGLIACGRSHYFSSKSEMFDALGFTGDSSLLTIHDFDRRQLSEYLELAGVEWSVPDWMPTRPLLIGYLVAMNLFSEIDPTLSTPAVAWRKLFYALCERESRIFTAVRPEVIRHLVSRVATIARAKGDENGPVDADMLRTAFIEVNGREPDEEGSQVLLRLPGLAISDSPTSDREGGGEERFFADKALAETAYGEDLAQYLTTPYDGHPLSRRAAWVTGTDSLGIGVAAAACRDASVTPSAVLAVSKRRQDHHHYDAVLADSLQVSTELDTDPTSVRTNFLIEGVIFPSIALIGNDPVMSRTTYKDCVVEILDVADLDADDKIPTFQNCLIGYFDGFSRLPEWLTSSFENCDIEAFSAAHQTTAAIMELNIPSERRVALTILKKIYDRPGGGRKEGALSRGLDMRSRELVPDVISKLVSNGWIARAFGSNDTLYVQVKGLRREVLAVLEEPMSFRF
ncbi:NACHT domain-containing protein [Actinomadura sp. DC4]|uniref:NACHT domain-containing protein n=1 Tax=Actinomadura sp. DC4 TaxID=3055069 RepID=UPI0025B22281|nr:NACHT domain-containing protein [Actinomadura sp. DC4]MDN3356810.1 NACHT domain-containing protein [Actinomadura sp. DC4]